MEQRDSIPIYIRGIHNEECEYIKVKRDRGSGIYIFNCLNTVLVKKKRMILTCKNCNFFKAKP